MDKPRLDTDLPAYFDPDKLDSGDIPSPQLHYTEVAAAEISEPEPIGGEVDA